MFGAIGRYFRAFFYLITGRIDRARKALLSNPDVVEATYDNVIDEKKGNLNRYKDAVGKMIAQEEKKKEKLKELTAEVERYEKLKAGAAAKAKKVAAKHNGDVAATKADPEYIKCQTAYKDFSSTLAEKEERVAELENDIVGLEKNIGEHKARIQSLLRDLEKIKEEKHDTVADVISAKEEKEIADMMSGISESRTSQELQELRDMRREAKAGARMSRELAGMDAGREEDEFLAFAEQDTANDEFDALIGLTNKDDSDTVGDSEKTRLPE